ncbi:hypothetical protein F985_01474 [Acinetobacter seifertii]|uniref:Uncharacterized protein n=1 Tax=Acinetobacter seifertii TaxID=1530123 RepID=N8SC82_9GAMM|nr:hypothetical protein F985_01474 [Acinetobacter seifertii]
MNRRKNQLKERLKSKHIQQKRAKNEHKNQLFFKV